jgi:predicted ribosome quality control (RQC) complex YloA/Tae2 family protein
VTLPTLEDPGQTVTLELDPALSAVQNAERRLRRYRKAKRAREAVAERLAAGRAELAYLEEQALALAHAEGEAPLSQLAAELAHDGVLPAPRAGGGRTPERPAGPLPPLAFDGGGGWRVLVGRNAGGNDRLTMSQAHPQDIWLHARQMPGSHVLLQGPAGTAGDPPDAVLLAAARCAAYYSAGRQGSHIPVDWTRRRHVWKPAGARPGFVLYEREHTLVVEPADLPPPLPPAG